jgi:DNA modification methylase
MTGTFAGYGQIAPIEECIPAARQSARRHYGVHPYFTRRPHNVVRKYILRYSHEGDLVLDPFGGSGVTAIEAFLENRTGVQNDINPLANFIASGIADLTRGSIHEYETGFEDLRRQCEGPVSLVCAASEGGANEISQRVVLPENVRLPSNSDVERYHDLFSSRQLCALAVVKDAIGRLRTGYVRSAMLLAWSATLTKLNRTFLSAEGRAESRGGSSIFSIYRYKVAKRPIELPPWETFVERVRNVLAAKAEIDKIVELKERTGGFTGRFQTCADDIDDLAGRFDGKADYIFTDPPYGGHISYLDLSTLWNVWLGQMPSAQIRDRELIVGGEQRIPEATYIDRLGKSISGCVRMLKAGRWLSVVFQHWNTDYFKAILEAASESGAQLRAAVSQVGDPIWSMHKKKGNQSVLAGELILTFFKTGRVSRSRAKGEFDLYRAVESILAEGPRHIYGEYLFNRMVLEAWNRSAIDSLNISKTEFVGMMQRFGWEYDEKRHWWTDRSAPESEPLQMRLG